MSHRGLLLDELWYCLCPSFTLNTFQPSGISLLRKTRPRRPASALPTRFHLPKRYNSNSAHPQNAPAEPKETAPQPKVPMYPFKRNPGQISRYRAKRQEKDCYLVPDHLRSLTTQEIEALLEKLGAEKPNVHSAMQKLQHLIYDRQICPRRQYYTWLIQCNAHYWYGSAVLVRQLLLEMEQNNIPLDSGALHAALQALAVHPDYTLRQDVLRAMRDRWLPLSTDGWHHVVASLIREHQFELALDQIAHMERKDIVVKDWLYSLLIYYLCEYQEFDHILELIRTRLERGYSISPVLWMHILNLATDAGHLSTLRFIWTQVVELGSLELEPQLCKRIFGVATEAGDTQLGWLIVLFLRHHGVPLEAAHYEQLSQMHILSDDLYSSLKEMCAMVGAGHTVYSSSIKPILEHCIASKIRAREVWAHLKNLKSQGFTIPPACARIVIELYREAAQTDPFEVDDGIAFYKQLYTLCPGKPDAATFSALIRMCRVTRDANSAIFVLHEMRGFHVLPDASAFKHLILLCLECGNFESANLYFGDMLERGLHLNQAARVKIRRLCRSSTNEHAVKLRQHPEISEDAPKKVFGSKTAKDTIPPSEETPKVKEEGDRMDSPTRPVDQMGKRAKPAAKDWS
ncbi:hypothetical protein BJX64DRAFT_227729 [Aspergillus heterothallicus]